MLEQHQQPPLLVGERAVWLGSGSGLPQGGHVRWIGKLPGMGPGWTVGLELDKELPYGGIDGSWCGRQLFQCQTKHGLLVPVDVVVKEDSLLRTFGSAAPKQQSSEVPPRGLRNPILKPKRTKSQSASSSRAGSQPSLAAQQRSRKSSVPHPPGSPRSPEEPIRPVVKPVRRNSKKAREQQQQSQQSPKSNRSSPGLPQPLPRSAFAPPLDSLPIDDSVLKLLAARLPQLSGVNILSEVPAPRKRRTSGDRKTPAVDLSLLPASSIRVPEGLGKEFAAPKEQESPPEPAKEVPRESPEPEAVVEAAEEPVQEETPQVAPEQDVVLAVEEEKPPEEDQRDFSEEEPSESSPPPPPPAKSKKDAKAGYFHTAPARPNRLRASVKKRAAPLPPVKVGQEDSAENSQLGGRNPSAAAPPPADDPNAPPRVPLRRHNSLNGPRRPFSDVVVAPAPTNEELIYQWFDAIGDAPSAPPRQHVPSMSSSAAVRAKGSPSISPSVSCTSFEDAVAAADAIYSQRVDKHFANLDSGSSVCSTVTESETSSSSTFTSSKEGGNRKSGGPFSSLFKWLRRDEEHQVTGESPLSRASSTNSLGTVVSAASSFAFVRPTACNNNNNNIASLHYASPERESDTYRLRLKQRDRSRHLDKGLTFKRKYKLRHFACSQETVFSETVKPTSARAKRKAPAPPVPRNEHYSDFSLPLNLEHRKRMDVMETPQVRLHRRTASESAKDKRAGAYCHVRGKRRAPAPPAGTRLALKPVTNFPSLGRNKKRPAPAPPMDLENVPEASRLSPGEKQRLIKIIDRAMSPTAEVLVTAPPIVMVAPEAPASPTPQNAPLSPRPWYKRSAKFTPAKQSSKKVEDEMSEVVYARVPPSEQSNRRSMQFTKFSDVDKEAVAIIQNNQQKAAELLAQRNNSFYLPASKVEEPRVHLKEVKVEVRQEVVEETVSAASAPPTKGLISKFNALTNISKVTVNSSKAALVGLLINNDKRISSPIPTLPEEAEEEIETKTNVEKTKDTNETKPEKATTPEKAVADAPKTAANGLYPRLSTFEPQPEPEERGETPLPLSIHGVSDGMTLNRQKKSAWKCPRCTLENESWRFTCDACNMWRPSRVQDEPTAAQEASGVQTVEEASKSIQKLANDVTKEEDAYKKPEPIGAIDWEAELKQYFPKTSPPEKKSESPPERKSESPPNKINARVAEAIKVLEGKQSPTQGPTYRKFDEPKSVYAVANKSVTKTSTEVAVERVEEKKEEKITAVVAKPPNTFIGGWTQPELKKDVPKSAAVASTSGVKTPAVESGKTVGSKEPTSPSPKDVDEMRKARLAFFISNNGTKEEQLTEAKPPASPRLTRAAKTASVVLQPPDSPNLGGRTAEIATDTAELVVTLKEKGAAVVAAAKVADLEEKLRIKEKLKQMKNSMAGVATTPPPPQEVATKGAIKKQSPPAQEKKVTTKVSSSAQTSAVILKAPTPKVTQPAVTTSPVVPKKMILRSPSFKGNGPFQLMGAKDFASIEATKSKTSSLAPPAKLQHVYANIPSPGLVTNGNSGAKNASPIPANASKLSSPSGTASPALPPKSPSPGVKVRPGIQPVKVVKVEINAQTVDDEYDDDDDDDEEFEDPMDDRSSMTSGPADSGSIAGSVGDSDVEKLAGTLTGAKGLAEFKATLATAPAKAANTLAVNRLLRRLEGAIANGQHRIAAGLARDLARLKISCKVERQKNKTVIEPEMFTVDMYVEDKVSHQGPIPLSVCASMTVGELRAKVHHEFEIPADCQRWILGKQLASDDKKTLQQHSVASGGCVVFLYLVAPPERTDSASPAAKTSDSPAPVASTPPPPSAGANPADVNKRILPLAPEDQRGPGWYYNFESERYSYCESSDEEQDPEEEPKQVQPLPPPKEKTPPPKVQTPPLAQPEEESDEEVVEQEEEAGAAAAAFEPTAPPATLTQEKKTGTLQLGWTCPLCTLINAPTRPGCAACTTDRPKDYKIPTLYETSDQEATRIKQEEENEKALDNKEEIQRGAANNYEALVALDKMDLVPNVDAFECPVCLTAFNPGEGAMLRECLHTFCRPCLAHTAQFSEEVEVHCPFRNDQYVCDAILQEREVRALVTPELYEKLQAKSVAQAENKIQNAFHCKTPDCRGWCIFEDNVNDFRCPVCGNNNCLTCQAIHSGVNCKQYQEGVTSETSAEAMRTKEMLQEMVERGEALCCPTCKVVLMKKWGCDWLRCSMCKTEICWVTRGPRWGPGGKGDLTGGCKCGVNGIKCHPKCNYCH